MAPVPCGFFDTRPKVSRDFVFGRDGEIEEIKRLLNNSFWPVILGPRRVGKTTVMRVVINELGGIYIDASTITGLKGLGLRLIDEVKRLNIKVKLNLAMLQLDIERRPMVTIEGLIRKLGDVVIGIDEIQNIISPKLPSLLSVAYNESRVRFIFSGSLVGTTRLIMKSPESLGRPLIRFELKPFTREQSIEFLRISSRNCGINISDIEIENAVNEFDGIVGWLTYYGSLRSSGKSHPEAMEALRSIAKEVIKDELSKLGRYELVTYRALATLSRARWIEIKRLAESLIGHSIDDKTFTTGLKALVNMYMVREVERGIYEVIDGYMARLVREYGV
ncbi:ATPase of the AAA superfamily [Vulcanisaeta moutnovskia 768-28]|uniref:ATPase of the AAA superfamily n=1 Tax=Vulcanisaeta moutnovskia (strain 768-28) TaxID=985053 RepID=F0QT20_VULM7|nr:ATP-binding protein [Vulcanisaeta moutnovskia]ADY01609.1 ATPase of the AAA superfamily [Vulcanisaeta moutnovskia 768-28]